jgi:ATP-dependent exoDNAse (exonuclease V) alpha subunit
MAKIILGKRPKSFKRTITFQMPGEEAGTIEVLFRYRTRSEVAALTDELQAKIKAEGDAEVERIKVAIEKKEDVPAQTQSDLTARQNAFNVQYLLAVIDGWNLDVPFDKEAAEQLADELPSAVAAIVSDYRGALHEGRLGN